VKKEITVALAGNPNSGKTTLFNNITGARQHVGNYPGVTVEKKEGSREHKGVRMRFVDLPGTYSLTAYSIEELIARQFVIDEAPDVLVSIVDASNLERNLYLVAQFIEMGVPLVVVLNMMDVAADRGVKIHPDTVSELIGCPVVATVGSKNEGTTELLDTVLQVTEEGAAASPERVRYGKEIEDEVRKIAGLLGDDEEVTRHRPPRWLAIKLLERDDEVAQTVEDECANGKQVLETAQASVAHLERVFGDDPEAVIADRRYGFARGVYVPAATEEGDDRLTRSDRIDKVVCDRFVGPVLFVLAMYLVFQLTFTLGGPPMGWLETFFGWAGEKVASLWAPGSDSPLKSLLVDGVIGGVGGVIVFLPNILLLFMAIAFLEDSGYMARAAFLVDKLMHKFGLHGKSFIPMVIGFGCNVPGIMATRTLDSPRDRLATLLVLPLMSCSARLPIYSLIIPAFFPSRYYARLLLLIYFIGIALAVVAAKILRVTLLRGEPVPFVMELPPYRFPTFRGILIHMWERSWLYVKKAGTLILGASIVMWFLTSYPKAPHITAAYDRGVAEAEAEAEELSGRLAAELRLPHESTLIRDALAAIRTGGGETDQVGRLAEFLALRRRVLTVRREFATQAAQLGDGLEETNLLALQKKRDDALSVLRSRDPELYAAVLNVVDRLEEPLNRRLAALAKAKQAGTLGYTVAGRIGRGLAVVLKPLGFDWRVGTALIGAFAAKEVFVAQLGIVFSLGEADEQSEGLRAALRDAYSPLVAFCIMLFTLISMPCIATVAVTRRETSSWGWTFLQLGGLTLLAYVITLVVYQLGTFLQIGLG